MTDFKKNAAGEKSRTVEEIIKNIKQTCDDSIERDRHLAKIGNIFKPYNL